MSNSIELAIFSGRLTAICQEMGYVLQRSALSPNIKDRLDFSCAFFDVEGRMCAQAAHIPVHLGSMAYAMRGITARFEWHEGDMVVFNDPFLGGTHLPDVTVVAPLFIGGALMGFVANRAHHANIGSAAPGSMPLSRSLEEEGVLISPVKLQQAGEWNEKAVSLLSRIDPGLGAAIPGDFMAQISANKTGLRRLYEWAQESNQPHVFLRKGVAALNDYGERLAREKLKELAMGESIYEDLMDDDGCGTRNIPIRVAVSHTEDGLSFDFSGTGAEVDGNINCPQSVTAAAVYYAVLSLLPDYIPHCAGVFEQIKLHIPAGCLLNASPGKAVAAGNVETSMRVVDVVLGGLGLLGAAVPADAQGTMNNLAMGCRSENSSWDYYETMGGGMGGGPWGPGLSGVQCHMTNTLNTPIESLEMHYPLRVVEYGLRDGSGGGGRFKGGDGLVRELQFLEAGELTILSERRSRGPRGCQGGADGAPGVNYINGEQKSAKFTRHVRAGDHLRIESPGGGGWG
ncbi:MAG: hydantoinase B/oxoprolinase family protein [Oleiphilaceae bacterium]|nr:hydantoinase B/oxoprolinase family protein [Oleiphilaceae bacterium]